MLGSGPEVSHHYYQDSSQVVGYTADADMWCPDCATAKYGDPPETDREGNLVHPVFADQAHSACAAEMGSVSHSEYERRHPRECRDRCGRCGDSL